MSEETLTRISNHLALLTQLVAVGLCEGKNRQAQIEMLGTAGLTPKAIADLLHVTPNQVSVTLYQQKKRITKQPKGKKGSASAEVADGAAG